jgi:hypothetical protein
MNTKSLIVVLVGISMVLSGVALAALPAPTNLSALVGADTVNFDWDDVTGAAKYSVDVEGTATYWDDVLLAEVTAEVEVSFGTSDRTDGGDMAESYLNVPVDDIAAAIASQLGIAADDVISLDGLAKVKALAPGKGAGSQNNPFSGSVDLDLTF